MDTKTQIKNFLLCVKNKKASKLKLCIDGVNIDAEVHPTRGLEIFINHEEVSMETFMSVVKSRLI